MVAGLQVALLLLVVTSLGLSQRPPPEPSLPALQHSYDCGSRGMQLLVPPRPGQTIRFKVMGEYSPGACPWSRCQQEVQGLPSCLWVQAPIPPSPHDGERELLP